MYKKYKNKKIVGWIKRYLPGEIAGTLTAIISAVIAYNISHSYVTAGIAGTVGENIGYYGYFFTREASLQYKKYRHHPPLRRTAIVASNTTKRLLIEFGLAEAMDSLFIRPYLMSIAPQHIAPYWVGTFIGKIAADSIFYSLAIIGREYEIKRKTNKSLLDESNTD